MMGLVQRLLNEKVDSFGGKGGSLLCINRNGLGSGLRWHILLVHQNNPETRVFSATALSVFPISAH